MQLRTKITSIFVVLTSLFLTGIFIFIYYFSKEYTEREFYLRLSQRATIAAQAYLDEGDLNVDIYEDIRLRHLQTLPNEKEVIYPVDAKRKKPLVALDTTLPERFYKKIFTKKYAELKQDQYYYTGLLYHDDKGDFIVVLSATDLYGFGKLDNLRNILIAAFFVSIIFIFFLGHYFAKQALSPILRIIEEVNSIRAENLSLRLDTTHGKDELADLSRTFNNMLDRLQISFDLQSNFINNASHELRNPLTAILGQTEIALNKERSVEDYLSTLKNIELEAARLDFLVNGLLKLAKTDFDSKGLVIEALRIDELVLDIKKNLDVSIPDNKIILDFEGLPENENCITLLGSESLLNVALSNILENGCKFSEEKKVTLKIVSDSDHILLTIKDEGVGIPEDELKNIFEPFFRASNVRGIEGFGFGLPLAYRIIKMHSGEIRVYSQENRGTIVKIKLKNKKHL
ncbi:HAMP domain-containing sensor histidine kinase [Ulvibacter litoralis]|uniref:histidine kinase n=1 Tax=Ulvibacter litoralis TaxID=227084 RepID=A0A1G7CPM5_9FLAO|nr:ATP-binding protein [Ulvibacter litoralis]GHC46578.1 two-component sensor histidine kinase [Ulvibacter litoralis]SDE41302.1 Signal transduction histidine kinase [Ulvibacter litoralis]